jgi:hypothetical protein
VVAEAWNIYIHSVEWKDHLFSFKIRTQVTWEKQVARKDDKFLAWIIWIKSRDESRSSSFESASFSLFKVVDVVEVEHLKLLLMSG